MSEVLILGIGSPEPDDSIGWQAAEYLRRAGSLPSEVRVQVCDRPGVTLLAHFRRAPQVILIDAMKAGLAPGSVRAVPAEELVAAESLSSHDVGVAEAVALAAALGELPQRLSIIGIEAGGDPAISIARVAEEVQRQLARPGARTQPTP